MGDLLTNWLTDWQTYWLAELLSDWLAYWLADLLTCWLANWLIDRLNCWLTYRLACLPTYWTVDWLTCSINDWLTDWLTVIDWLIDWLAYGQIGLTGWSTYWRFMLRMKLILMPFYDKNQNNCLLIKVTNFSFQIRCVQQMSTATGFTNVEVIFIAVSAVYIAL